MNKLGDAELAREKQKMDKQFDQNFVKPGDAGFQYDKVVDFKAGNKESNSWDNSQSGGTENYSEDWE